MIWIQIQLNNIAIFLWFLNKSMGFFMTWRLCHMYIYGHKWSRMYLFIFLYIKPNLSWGCFPSLGFVWVPIPLGFTLPNGFHITLTTTNHPGLQRYVRILLKSETGLSYIRYSLLVGIKFWVLGDYYITALFQFNINEKLWLPSFFILPLV